MLIVKSQEIINTYRDKLTIRQLYYRLVSKQIIANNRSQYVYLDKVLTEHRQKNPEFSKYFDDKTRNVNDNIYEVYPTYNFTEKITDYIRRIKNTVPRFNTNNNLLQNDIPVILLEKQALETIFENALLGYPNILVVARGFNSFTQMYELSEMLKQNPNKRFHLYVFTDYDDSGILIQNNFLNQMRKHLKIRFQTVNRIALTQELIELYDIPKNPVKQTTHSKYNLKYFVELDALEPNILKRMVREVAKKHYNQELFEQIQKTFRVRNKRLRNAYLKQLRKVDLSII